MSSTKTFLFVRTRRIAGICIAFALSGALICAPALAFADVRTSDIVAGLSVEQRGLTTSDCPNIVAERSILVSEDGTVYFERDADAQCHIASVTKVMTSLVALQYGDPQNTQITISDTAASIGESSAQLKAGDTMTLETALKALMLASGNDAAQGIAESMGEDIKRQLQESGDQNVPESSYDVFIYAMNKKAAELGMTNSLFANPHGLDFDNYDADMHSSARDVATMCAEAMKNDVFREIVKTPKTTIQVTRATKSVDIKLESTDVLLGELEGACGIKTGYTEKAGECFAGAVERDGKLLYAIVLGSNSESQRFTDAKTLDEWFYGNSVSYPLVHSSETTSYDIDGQSVSVPVVADVAHSGWIDRTFKTTLSDPNASVDVFALEGNVSQEFQFDSVSGDVVPGQRVGTVTFYQHNEVIATADVVAAEYCAAPNVIEGIGIWWDRLWRGFNGDVTVAQSFVVNKTPLIYGPNAETDSNTATLE